ncbi:MAG: PKD domain-containing protein [Patescibacteria group bacterium]
MFFDKKQILLICALFLIPAFSHAQVAKIVFTTEVQTINPNEISSPLTIQTQDSSGALYKTPETIDLQFLSSSPTGEFLSSTGNAVTKTMSTNTSNRTFYYRDSTEGKFTITVDATGRSSGSKWSANQDIVVGNVVTTTGPSQGAGSGASTQTVTTASSGGGVSAHYSSVSLSDDEPNVEFKVGAGRERLGTVGTPIEFMASSNSKNPHQTSFIWSFGDASIAYGATVTHTYSYPGDYVAVLNAQFGNDKAVARVNIKIVPDSLVITHTSPERIEVSNNGKMEVNLYGRAVIADGKSFVFPEDTIIKAGQKISFPQNITGLSPISSAMLALVSNRESSVNSTDKNLPPISEEKQKEISKIYDQILALQIKQMELKNVQKPTTGTSVINTKALSSANLAFDNATTVASSTQTRQVRNDWFSTVKRFFGFK